MVPPKCKYGNKGFVYRGVFKCVYCGSTIIGEDKHKLLKNGEKKNEAFLTKLGKDLKIKMQKYSAIRNIIFESQKILPTALTFSEYSTHVLNGGDTRDKQEATKALG